MNKSQYTFNHLLLLFLKIICTFDYQDGILRLWDNHRTRVTVNKITKILHFNYDEYNFLMEVLKPFNVIYEVTIGDKRFIQIDERVIKALDKAKETRNSLKQRNDKISMQKTHI